MNRKYNLKITSITTIGNLILVIYLVTSCNNKGNCQSKSDPYLPYEITINCDSCEDQKVELLKVNMVSGRTVTINGENLDHSNKTELVGLTNESALTILKIGENSGTWLYVRPGTKLKIFSTEKEIRFEGTDAKMNQFFRRGYQAFLGLENQKSNILLDFPEEQIRQRLTIWKVEIDKINREVENDQSLDAKSKKIIVQNNLFLHINLAADYLNEKVQTTKSAATINDAKFLSKLPIEQLYIDVNMESYRTLIKDEFQNIFMPKLYKQLTASGKSVIGDSIAFHADRIIMDDPRLRNISEYLRALNVNYWLHNLKAISDYERPLDNFKISFPNSKYLTELELTLDKYNALGKGKNAKNFTANLTDGKQISLDQFKGKVIYIDTWATWCGPCIKELPASEKLQEYFKKDTSLVFMYLSIDTNINNWKKFLEKKPNLGGIHCIQSNPDKGDFIWKLYNMQGIPHYILIDKEGKISKNFASRPSSQNIKNEIESLLIQ